MSAQDKVHASLFGVHELLDSIAAPSDYKLADLPTRLRTKPKSFQLQVRSIDSAVRR